MANVANSTQFYKKYGRQRRQVLSEESFGLGMHFTNNPLSNGQVKTLINYDICNNGETLKPRNGIVASAVSVEIGDCTPNPVNLLNNPDYTTGLIGDNPDYPANLDIINSIELSEENDENYIMVLSGVTIQANIFNDLYKDKLIVPGSVALTTIYPKDKHIIEPEEGIGTETLIPDVDTLKAEVDVLEQNTIYFHNLEGPNLYENYEFYFRNIRMPSIHGMDINKDIPKITHIGTYLAAEGTTRYYCFMRDKLSSETNLVFTTFKDYPMMIPSSEDPINVKMYQFEKLEPKPTVASDASLNMYNMLHPDPYDFADTYGSSTLQLRGIYTTTTDGTKVQTTYLNTQYRFRMNYAVNLDGVFKVLWEWKETNSSLWNTIEEKEVTFTGENPPPLYVDWSSPSSAIVIKVTVTPQGTTEPSQVMPVGFEFKKDGESNNNLGFVNYDLSTCLGMTSWKQRLIVYGVEGGRNMLFASEPNNPAWFPFPRNVDLFDEPIIKCIPYLDFLLVFTETSLYRLALLESGDGWTKRVVQRNLHLQLDEVNLIQSIKNMVFFKSNNYYYMIVPSAVSDLGLTLAPISKPINDFFDNFESNINEILIDLYDLKIHDKIILLKYHNYIDYNSIRTVFTFVLSHDPEATYSSYTGHQQINVMFIYDIELRNWRLYVYPSEDTVYPHKIDVTNTNILISKAILGLEYVGIRPGDLRRSFGYQFLKYNPKSQLDKFIKKGGTLGYDKMYTDFITYGEWKNYTLLDTGYREQESDFKKRYRELAFKVNNFAQVPLDFYTQFILDGYLRREDASYVLNKELDPYNWLAQYGTITYDRVFNPEKGNGVPGSTILGSDENDKTAWTLDVSEFPETIFWQMRIPISGKGYVPRLKLYNTDQEPYELLNISWVFRTLYLR